MYIILSIVVVSLLFLILSFFKKGKIKNSPEAFLKSLGYSYQLVDEKKIVIPKKFGDNMQKYNELQKKQGFNLKKYAGKICTQKKYLINVEGSADNKNGNSENYVADVIVFDGAVVGGDVREQLYGSELKKLDSLR